MYGHRFDKRRHGSRSWYIFWRTLDIPLRILHAFGRPQIIPRLSPPQRPMLQEISHIFRFHNEMIIIINLKDGRGSVAGLYPALFTSRGFGGFGLEEGRWWLGGPKTRPAGWATGGFSCHVVSLGEKRTYRQCGVERSGKSVL